MSMYLLVVFAIFVGCGLAAQAGINSQLRSGLSTPIQAAFISFLIGTIILGIIAFSQKQPWFSKHAMTEIPWWAWLGGFLGAFNIAMSIFLAPKLGALTLAVAIVCGQVIASLMFDHHGWLGYPTITLTPQRLFGALCIVVGVIFVSK
ncbi:DMT family transporter [Thalassotalea ponticola]|uniref:DMT family transporter n=1 Tax=Thalassotalea ponticola TaxID=1523392 RepID=UPI0025B337BE|nr:DMT family transporter [Thalassotalea ponticola]MDN3651488.1 DMT family transporter [Thalassotalea ponticola]